MFSLSYQNNTLIIMLLSMSTRLAFESETLTSTRERLRRLENTIQTEKTNLDSLNTEKGELQQKLAETERTIDELREGMNELQEALDQKTKVVEQMKKISAKAAKVLDAALKEISSCVSCFGIDQMLDVDDCRMMKLRSWPWRGLRYTGNVGWRRSSCL